MHEHESRDFEGLESGTQEEAEEETWRGPDQSGVRPAPSRPTDDLVARCLADLIDDWQRKGGRLSYDDVTRMTTKRALDGHQLASLLEALTQAGVALAGLQAIDATGRAKPADEYTDNEDAERVTSADRDALGAYLKEIGRYPLLWAEDEVRLGRLIRTGQDADAVLSDEAAVLTAAEASHLRQASEAGRRAHAELVRSNLRLVVSIARKFGSSGMDLLDLIQEGNLGLLRAADKFDYTLGYKFSTYATWWIRQSLQRGIADRSRLIRLPVHFHDRLIKVLRMQRRLADRYGHDPSLEDLAAALEMDPGEVQAVLDWAQPTVSLDAVLVQEGDLTLGDLLAAGVDVDGRTDPVDIVMTAARLRDIDRVLDQTLDARAALIIRRRFGIGGRAEETLDAIGHDLGVTRERVRQIEVKAMEVLATSVVGRELYEYLVTQTRRANAQPIGGWREPEKKQRKRKTTLDPTQPDTESDE